MTRQRPLGDVCPAAAVVVEWPGLDQVASVLGCDAENARETRDRLLAAGWRLMPMPGNPEEVAPLIAMQHPAVQQAVRKIMAAQRSEESS